MNGKLNKFEGGSLSHITWDDFKRDFEASADEKTLRKEYDRLMQDEIWINNEYQVNINKNVTGFNESVKIWHLSIKRRDKEPIHDWRDLQAIKNMLVGEEYEAIEIYPAESRVVDTANQYHLWAFMSFVGEENKTPPRIPVGWTMRSVTSDSVAQSKQRAL